MFSIKLPQRGSIQLKILASDASDAGRDISSTAMVPVVFKTAGGTTTVLMARNASMADIQQRFAEVICSRARLSHAPKRRRVSKAATAAAAAKLAREIVITCDGRVLREETLADACPSAGATTIEVSLPLSGGGRSGRSIDRAGIERIVRDVAQKAAKSSDAWREKTNGGKTVTSHSLRSAFMNRVDPDNKASAEVFPGKAPFHPNDRYPVCSCMRSQP